MHFSTKSYLKNTRNHTDKHAQKEEVGVVHKVGFSVSAAAVSQFVGRDLFNQWYALSAHVCLSTSSLIYLLTDELEDLEAVILNPDRSGGLIWNLADLETGPVRVCQRTGQTRSTRLVNPWPGWDPAKT
jgi:hypothetical protein